MDKIWGQFDSNGNLEHILRNSGDIAPFDATAQELKDCCCVENTCNSCDPAIPDTLYVTFPSGLTGWLAPYAGNTYALPYFRNCEWYMYGLEYPSSDFDQYSHGRGDDYVAVMYDYAYGYDWSDGSPQWHVEIADTTAYYCILEWWAVGCSECDPRCNYDTIECDITSSSCGFGCSSDVPSNEYPTVAYL